MSTVVILLAAFTVAVLAFSLIKKRYKLRTLHNLPGPPPTSLWLGVAREMYSPLSMPYRMKVFTSYGRAIRIPVLFGDSVIAVSDPLAIATLLNGKDASSFDLPGFFTEMMNVVFGPSLVGVRVTDHHKQRKMLNPMFALPRLRKLVPTFSGIAHEMVATLKKCMGDGPTEIDISQMLSGYTLECVGRSALGRSFGALDQDGTEYSRALKRFGGAFSRVQLLLRFLPWVRRSFPPAFLRFCAERVPLHAFRDLLEISDRVYVESKDILREKEDRLEKPSSGTDEDGKDLMSILVKQNSITSTSEALSNDALIGQMSMFLISSTDTTSTTITRVVELLAKNPDVQTRVRQELIQAMKETGRSLSELDHEAFSSLQYLDAVVRETLRMYSVFQVINRSADVDTVIPLSDPVIGKNGRPISELFVPVGTLVVVNNVGVNYDPSVWGPDAHEWKPERWFDLPLVVVETKYPSVYSHIMTFGAGTRACIGYNMAILETKIAICHLVMAFKLSPSDKDVVWQVAGVISPTIRGSKFTRPVLPVVISRAD